MSPVALAPNHSIIKLTFNHQYNPPTLSQIMSRKTLDERLAELTKQQEQLEARRAALLAAKKETDRKRDARRKIIIGAAVLAHAELHPAFADQLRGVLNRAVQRPIDRNVIADLLGIEEEASGEAGGKAA
jgi:hypothetical protein